MVETDVDPEERALVRRAKRGDDRAFTEIVRRHQETIFRTAWVITRNATDAEDVAGRAFHKAHRALGRFRDGEPLRPWLLTIVANEARSHRRTAARREAATLRFAAEEATHVQISASDRLVAAEGRRRLLAAINDLAPAAREVVTCRYLLELSEAETAVALGTPIGTVKSRTARALAALREQLEEEHR